MKYLTILSAILLAGCTGKLTDEKLSSYPNQFLCDLVNPQLYITTPNEQVSVYKELEKRGVECTRGPNVIIQDNR